MSKARGLADLGNAYSDGALSNRNLIINGAMQVAQRGTSVTGVNSTGYYTLDRFGITPTNLGTWMLEKSTDAPDGFSSSHKITCTTADASPIASANLSLFYKVEGQDLQMLAYGTSSAKDITVSFWVKSSIAGNASFEIQQKDNSNKQATPQYSINAANTWEYKQITIAGDTSGVINNDDGIGLFLRWWLNSGSNYTGGTNQPTYVASVLTDRNASNLGLGGAVNDTFQITGVQLEVGDTATPFEHRSYGDELQRCMRYYEKIELPFSISATGHTSRWGSGIWSGFTIPFQVTKRAQPTISEAASGVLWRRASRPQATATDIGSGSYGSRTAYGVSVYVSESGRTNGEECVLFVTAGDYIEVEAEL